MAKPLLLPPKLLLRLRPSKSLPRKRERKKRKTEQKPRSPPPLPHKFRSRARKKRLALRRWSVRSPVNTASISRKFLAPDLAAAFRSKTSCLLSSASRQRPPNPQLLPPSHQPPRLVRLHRPLRIPAIWFP